MLSPTATPSSDTSIPLFVERAVERTLAKDPNDRFQSAREFAEALTSEMVVARVGRRSWTRLAVVAPVTIAVLAAAAWGYLTFLGGPTYERLAVLPPTNLMNDPEQDYFVQGMHNALITELQRAGVSVIALWIGSKSCTGPAIPTCRPYTSVNGILCAKTHGSKICVGG